MYGLNFGIAEVVIYKANRFIVIDSISELSNCIEFLKYFFPADALR